MKRYRRRFPKTLRAILILDPQDNKDAVDQISKKPFGALTTRLAAIRKLKELSRKSLPNKR